jgi:hypothetical protein
MAVIKNNCGPAMPNASAKQLCRFFPYPERQGPLVNTVAAIVWELHTGSVWRCPHNRLHLCDGNLPTRSGLRLPGSDAGADDTQIVGSCLKSLVGVAVRDASGVVIKRQISPPTETVQEVQNGNFLYRATWLGHLVPTGAFQVIL